MANVEPTAKAGWGEKILGEVCDILDNQRKPIAKRNRVAGPFPYYGATGVLDHVEGFLFDEELVLVGEDGAKWDAGENSAFPISGKCWVNNHAHVLRPNRSEVLDQWLISYLNYSDLSEYITGLTVPKLNQGKLREIPIPVPPIAEQERIVGILDEAFEGIAAATAQAEKNLHNARELFQSVLQSMFSQKGDDWVETTLGDVCELAQGLAINKNTKHLLVEKSSLPLLRIKDLKEGTAEQFVAETGYPEKARIYGEDLIYTRTGQIGLVFTGREGILHNNSFKITPNRTLQRSCLYWWLQNPVFKASIIGLASRAAQPDITHKIFKLQKIVIPPLPTQQAIVEKLDALSEETKRLKAIYERKQAALSELKQSLLQKAFAGEL